MGEILKLVGVSIIINLFIVAGIDDVIFSQEIYYQISFLKLCVFKAIKKFIMISLELAKKLFRIYHMLARSLGKGLKVAPE